MEEINVAQLHEPGEGDRIGATVAARWSTGDEPFAILAVTDTLAHEVLAGIMAGGRCRTPEHIAVMGIDGNRMARGTPITLTTLTPPGEAMGRRLFVSWPLNTPLTTSTNARSSRFI